METDSQFIDNFVVAVQEEPQTHSHDDWVEQHLAEDFMRNAAATMLPGLAALVSTVILLLSHVNSFVLAAWSVIGVAILAYRYYTVQVFKSILAGSANQLGGAQIPSFFHRHGWSWPASAFVYALPAFLYLYQAPPTIKYLCLIILIGIGATAAPLMAANLTCQRRFSHTLAGTALAAGTFNGLSQWPNVFSKETTVFLLLIILFWLLILYLGKQLHQLQRSSYSAQFGNEKLIHSLRQQTYAATEAVQMKNNLLASAAHDLRQPVHALAFYADWLRSEPQMAASVIPKILAATDSVNTLFNSLFDFARIEAGTINVRIAEVDVAEMMEEMVVQFAPAADKKSLSLSARVLQVKVQSDPILIRRVISNLLANAIRYTDKGGVLLAARQVGSKLWLEVSDSGIGIAPEHLPHVFKEFYRAPGHSGTADSFGLGLAIVQRLCRTLGHTVTIRSVLGRGTRCRIEILLGDPDANASLSVPMPLDQAQHMYAQMTPRDLAQ